MIFEFAMYYLSFLPLWVSVIFIDAVNCFRETKNLWTETLSIVVIVIGIIVCSVITWKWLTKGTLQNCETYTIKSAKEERCRLDREYGNQLLTYQAVLEYLTGEKVVEAKLLAI